VVEEAGVTVQPKAIYLSRLNDYQADTIAKEAIEKAD
jgi:hypothetical protein